MLNLITKIYGKSLKTYTSKNKYLGAELLDNTTDAVTSLNKVNEL